MLGWIISLLSDSAQNNTGAPYKDEYCSLSWSPYDRIMIKEARSFTDLCTASCVTKKNDPWPGSERTMHIVLDPKNSRKEPWKLSDDIKVKIIDNDFAYYCIVSLRFSDVISHLKNGSDFIEKSDSIRSNMYSLLDDFIEKNGLECDYRGFQPLSVEDVIVIICANDLSTIDKCIKFLKTLRINNFEDPNCYLFYSITNFSGLNDFKTTKNPNMDALVKLTIYPYLDEKEVINKFIDYLSNVIPDEKKEIIKQNIKVRSSCLFVELKYDSEYNIVDLYKNNAVFNGISDFYKAYVKSSRTYWIERNNCNLNSVPVYVKVGDIKPEEENDSKNDCSDDSVLEKDQISSFISGEFNRLINTSRFESWKPILQQQRDAFNTFANEYKKAGNNKDLCDLINLTQNSLSIINQACSPVYEIPYHNSFFSSSHNDLLKMYYGLISSIFQIGFSMKHEIGTIQHPICFGINLEPSLSIHSRMFTVPGDEIRFVFFSLPSDQLYDYPTIIPSLIHEVFHYIAPYDRKERAENIIYVMITKMMFRAVSLSFEKFDDFSEEEQSVVYQFYLSKPFINKILADTISFVKKIQPDFFVETFSYVSETYFDNFKSLKQLYIFIYDKTKKLINEEYKNLLTFRGYKSEEYEDKTIEQIFEDEPLKLIEKVDINYVFSSEFTCELFDFMSEVMINIKEVFCDICIAKILDMSLSDYLLLYFRLLIKKADLKKINRALDAHIGNDTKFNISSTDLRLLLLVLFFIDFKDPDLEESKISTWLSRNYDEVCLQINDAADDEKKLFKKFSDSITKIIVQDHELYYVYIDAIKSMCNFCYILKSFNENNISSIIDKLRCAYHEKVNNDINLDHIRYFTYYYYDTSKVPQLHSLTPDKKKLLRKETSSVTFNQFYYSVSSVSEYISLIMSIINQETNFKLVRPWFRGVCSREFSVTPSLFRAYDQNFSLYANQANIIKYQYEKTLHFANLWKLQIRDQMCFLQHYGVSTNLLDFSLDMLVALHFALNPDIPEDKEKIDNGNFHPIVYIFDPIEYGKAVLRLHDEKIAIEDTITTLSPIVHTIGKLELDKYFVTDMSIEKMIAHTKKYNTIYTPSIRQNEYPVPLIVPQSNDRIHIQNGTFLAYSLNSKPATQDNTRFDYLSLQSIQEQYTNLFASSGLPERRFLHKVLINVNAVEQIRKELKNLSISEGRVYPEYSIVFREGMAEYKSKQGLNNT